MINQLTIKEFRLQKKFDRSDLTQFHKRKLLIVHNSKNNPIEDETVMISTTFWKPHFNLYRGSSFNYTDCDEEYIVENIHGAVLNCDQCFQENYSNGILIRTIHGNISHNHCCVGINLYFDFKTPGIEDFPLELSKIQIIPGLSCPLSPAQLGAAKLKFHILSL